MFYENPRVFSLLSFSYSFQDYLLNRVFKISVSPSKNLSKVNPKAIVAIPETTVVQNDIPMAMSVITGRNPNISLHTYN